MILLGERGQAKTRLIRAIVNLLDEPSPAIAGCEINDHPFRPICARCRALVAEQGDAVQIVWIPREERYAEKLATPDTAVADLIGDVDPIRVAEGRYLADELTIHYGMIPRTNRGIVAINELPDLPERIQVSLFNILEERDVQIRGYRIRLPLDLLLVVTANPDDYTHRGRIVSPLKDRFGTQVRTHYPETLAEEVRIMDAGGAPGGRRHPAARTRLHEGGRRRADLGAPPLAAREPPQRRVSVRYSIGNVETLGAAAVRRAALTGEPEAVPRVERSSRRCVRRPRPRRVRHDRGGPRGGDRDRATRTAVLEVFRRRLSGFDFAPILVAVRRPGFAAETSDRSPPPICWRGSAICPDSRSCSSDSASPRRAPGLRRAPSSSRWKGCTCRVG